MTISTSPDDKEEALQFDISETRRTRKWTKKDLVGRALWETVGKTLFALSPRPLWGARRALLRAFGAQVGREVHILPSVKIAIPWNLEIQQFASVGDRAILYSLGLIKIGERATISQYAHICAGTHDYRKKSFDLLKPSVSIGSDAWICADAFVGPDVTIGKRAIIGARAVVVKNVEEGHIMVGNPAYVLGERPKFE
jgi:putative colanic acid biosynthesis acetyltransferase WcaF